MKQLKRFAALLCLAAMLLTMLPVTAQAEEATTAEFVVLSTTDVHGKCWNKNVLTDASVNNSLLRVSTAVKEIRETYGDNVVLVDNGDLYQGTPVSSYNISKLTQGLTEDMNPMAICLTEIGYDAAVLGNHEFNYSFSVMEKIRSYLTEKGVSTICANLYYADGTNVFTPYITKELTLGGKTFKIGILGMENTDCTRWDVPDNYPGIRFAHPDNENFSVVWEVNRYVPQMKAEGCDFIIVSYHAGLGTTGGELQFGVNTENQVARVVAECADIDMVIAGHDHSSGYSNTVYTGKGGKEVLVVNAGGTSLTKSVFTAGLVDGELTVSLKASENLDLSTYADDTNLAALIKPYADDASAYVNTSYGKATGEWDGKTNYYLQQTDTIDLINRAQIAQGNIHLAEKFNTEEKLAALYAETGLDHLSVDLSSTSVVATSCVRAGDISMKNIYQYYKYDNTLYLVPMTGAEIKTALEWNAENRLKAIVAGGTVSYSTKGDDFTNPVFYGLDFTYDMYQPVGSRVVISQFADGRAFELDKTYIVAINNYHLGNTAGPFADISTSDAIWSQTDDLGGGVVQDLMAEFIKSETETNGGVSPVKSNWSLSYSGDPTAVVEVNLKGDVYGEKTDTLVDGEEVLLYYVAGGTVLSTTPNGNRIDPATATISGTQLAAGTDAAVFTVEKNGDSFYLIADGKYLTSAETGNGLSFTDEPSECSLWYTKTVEGGVHIMNVGAAYNGNHNQALECYYDRFTTYGEQDSAAYLFNIYKKIDAAVLVGEEGLSDGGQYYIYYPDGECVMTDALNGAAVTAANGLIPLPAPEGAALLTVEYADDTNFYLTLDGKYLTSADTGNGLSFTEEKSDCSLWYLVPVTGGYHVMNVGAAYYGNHNQALEVWSNRFTTYGVKDTAAYLFNFYGVATAGGDTHTHTYVSVATAASCMEPGYVTHTCTGCGDSYVDSYVPALGHDIVNHACTRCNYTEDCPSAEFSDLDTTRWYHEGVDFVLKNGYMAGTDKGFQPDAALTREMLAQILYAKAGKPAVTITGRFPDEDTSRWYAAAIEWAAENGYIAGYGNGNFGVGDAVTREQIAVILYAYEGKPDVGETTLDSYPDAGQVSGWARTAMVWAVENGLITGNAKGELMPKDAATRATFAVIFYAYLEK